MSMISLYTAFSALQAAQAGTDTASNNVANAGTAGYTRQRVELASRSTYQSPVGPIGTGVDVIDISRARDRFADRRVWANSEVAGRFAAMSGLLGTMDEMTMEPEGGITGALGDLWASFEQLALDPPDTAARLDTIAAMDAVTARIRDLAGSWTAQIDRAGVELRDTVGEVNTLLRDLGPLNVQILDAATVGAPNDLLDSRDRILDRLTELAGVAISDNGDGTVRVSLNGLALVDGSTVHQIAVDGSYAFTDDSGNPLNPGGALAGYAEFLTNDAPALMSGLDTFAADLADAINAAHAAGFTPSGAAGGPLLTYTPGAAASTIAVAVTDPSQIAAAGNPGPPVPAFDGTNADAIAALRDAAVALSGTTTIDGAFRQVVTDVGSRARLAATNAESSQNLLRTAQNIRESRQGVSLDEEMADLIRYQRSYEAAARVMTAVDQLLDTLVNRTGLVGR